MRALMIVSAVLIGAGTFMAQTADKMTAATPARAMASSRQPAHSA
jgi:aspartyl protease family protein